MSSTTLSLGQVLRGRKGVYTISKKIQDTVWLALNRHDEIVVVKSVSGHARVDNERDVLRRFQSRSSYIRPLLDEILSPEGVSGPTTIVLRYLDDHLLQATSQKKLNGKEIKYVSRRVLEALNVLHGEGFVHTDVKLNNIFVNYKDHDDGIRFSNIQLGDFGGTYPQDSKWATSGTPIGAPIWNSPEVLMQLTWNTATDIWSFGAVVISLLYGGDFNLFRPKGVRHEDENYRVEVVKSQFRYFGPFPAKIKEVVNEETLTSILYLMHLIPPEKMTPFRFVSEREVFKEDTEFILRIMQLDWRDRPTAQQLLQNKWFHPGAENIEVSR